MKKILLVEPAREDGYYTQYPPLGLLKLAALEKSKGNEVKFVRGYYQPDLFEGAFMADKVYITSLFTYAYHAVHKMIAYYLVQQPQAEITVGGVYASMCPDNIKKEFGDKVKVHVGLHPDAENMLPDYSLVPEYEDNIIHASRGCVRKCEFCAVPKVEGKIKYKHSIKKYIRNESGKLVFFDNNFTSLPSKYDILEELKDYPKQAVDFNQGLDARLIDKRFCKGLSEINIPMVRIAYDDSSYAKDVEIASKMIIDTVGIRGREILAYVLYNFKDTPDDFLKRIKDCIKWGIVAYPMRYEPLVPSEKKGIHIGEHWSERQLKLINKAKGTIGTQGGFPPSSVVYDEIMNANTLEDAFTPNEILKSREAIDDFFKDVDSGD